VDWEHYDTMTEEEQTVFELREGGADLSKPQKLEHYLLFPMASMAQAAARELERTRYRVVVEPDEEAESGWSVVAGHEVLIEVGRLRQLRAQMEALARGHGGEYDGWNVPYEAGESPLWDEDPTAGA
jgi:regulator of RNase E activity RraB